MDHLAKRFYTREEMAKLAIATPITHKRCTIVTLAIRVIRQWILDTCLPLLYKTFSITLPHYITAQQSEGLNTATNCNSTQSGVKLCNYNNNHNIRMICARWKIFNI